MSAQPQAHTASPPRGKWVTADDRQLYDPSCPIDRIDDHPDNPPSRLDDLEELVASIEEKGVLTPVLLTPRGKRFQLLAGHRRRAAARRAGLATIPAIIRETTEQEALELLLIENLQREDLRPSEEARALQRLIDTGLSQHEVAKRVGKAQGHVSKRVALLVLPVSVLRQVDSGGISLAGAAELTKLAAHPERMKHVLSGKGVGGDLAYKVSHELREIGIEEKNADLVAKHKAKGITILPSASKWQAVPKEPAKVIGAGWGCIDVDKRAHAKESCHAVIIAQGEAVACCTDPKRHKKEAAKKKETAEDRAFKAEQQARKDAAKARRALHLDMISRGTGLDRLFAVHAIHDAHIDRVAEALRILGREVPPLPKDYGERHDAEDKLREALSIAAVTRAGADRVLGALALACAESEVDRRYIHPRMARAYFDCLKAHGYKPTKTELELLEQED